MTGVQKLEHAKLNVAELADAVEFYTEVMGLVELTREEDVVYLGAGVDAHFDLAVESGGTGVDHFAIREVDEGGLDRAESALDDHDIRSSRPERPEPGRLAGLKFDLPSGVTMELVVMDKDGYNHITEGSTQRSGCGPVDLDHITLATPSPRRDAEFLRDVLGWNVSDAVQGRREEWELAFTRSGDYHHDVGLIRSPNDNWTLYHLGWTFASFDHMKTFADELASHGHMLEMGMNRHYFGDNLFAYFQEPGGNRFEITAEMATMDESTPMYLHTADSERKNVVAAWGGISFPESMKEGT